MITAPVGHWHLTLLPEGQVKFNFARGEVGDCCEGFATCDEMRAHETNAR